MTRFVESVIAAAIGFIGVGFIHIIAQVLTGFQAHGMLP